MTPTLPALCGFAFAAGFIDSAVGGGGLIQVPALFVLMPQIAPATLLGTNKFASVWGTAAASWQYARRVPLPWHALLPACAAAFAASNAGAHAVSALRPELLRPLILVLMLAVLAYTLWKKDLGALHAPRLTQRHEIAFGVLVGAVLGFYDGFFGPGTGSFLIFAFVGLFGFSFLAASASAKLINLTTNLAAIGYFAYAGNILYAVAVPMAACNVAGAVLGSHLAIRKGSGHVRGLFILIVGALIARFAWDMAR
ncbi:MAG: sulfite exporter TauE/SafE family protein [Nevskiaceae bacterium]|nr:MAG: sulfite exporter TauE/SafE family protein [Nevskiaceae bacterium]